ncbi:hypothetical protein GWK47_036094 [Chionoecetes opilio]|uniref:Uncharacterized protein n=1 Tax=Chionoecetes opilio TaxID=41210 RepID=A0A8J4YP24_CHIOP|nr:hypothetical protein GWK47_036094 [Chionoecetes opilio]
MQGFTRQSFAPVNNTRRQDRQGREEILRQGSMKAKTLASSVAVDVAKDKKNRPRSLFQRFLVVSQTADLSLDEVMAQNFHHTHHPSLRAKNSLTQTKTKTQLMAAIKEQSSDDGRLKDVPEVGT